ncbi:MAG: hydroxyproline-2-epimerase [bacterium]|nr:hydroxyproline-2-epimerase [bacterium]
MDCVHVVDSHTGGEPTRVVIQGGPQLGTGTISDKARRFAAKHDNFRSAIINEPRGADAWVGALLAEPSSSSATSQVIFFNNVGLLGMCVHGTIGVAATLAHLERVTGGRHILETPVGDVKVEIDGDRISVENVPSYLLGEAVEVETSKHGTVCGDIAWGGNWFFLTDGANVEITAANVDALTNFAWDIRCSLEKSGITATDGAVIDHVELFGPPTRSDADSKNFVLCPGKAYDRSPCGTGTSAKMACLAARNMLAPGQSWRQESIIGSVFEGSYSGNSNGSITPTITGSAYVTAESKLLFDQNDPFRTGIRFHQGGI